VRARFIHTPPAAAASCSSNRSSLSGDLRPELGAFLGDGASDVLSLHVSLDTDDDTGAVYNYKR